MKLAFVIEDLSGKEMLRCLVPKIIDTDKILGIKPYHGIGEIPPKTAMAEAFDRLGVDFGSAFQEKKNEYLLGDLSRLLRVYAETYKNESFGVIIVCDLDRKNKTCFENKLQEIINSSPLASNAKFCLAVEEGEAWLLGDLPAIQSAYTEAKIEILSSYVNDSICGTWEKLADAIYPGGSTALCKKTDNEIGKCKCDWAKNIAPLMDVDNNQSPSFRHFKETVETLVE